MKIVASEEDECMTFVNVVRYQFPRIAKLMYHIPNGGFRSKGEAVRFKKLGVLAGVSDYCIPVARGAYHSLYIEMKRKEGGSVQPNQAEFIRQLRSEGNFADVCSGCEEAIALMIKYLNLKENEMLPVKFMA